jgi:hypothetical protein
MAVRASAVDAISVAKPVEEALEDVACGELVHHFGPPVAPRIGLDQHAIDRRGGKTLVPEGDRQGRQPREISRKGPRGLGPRTLGAVHVEWQAENQAHRSVLPDQAQQPRRVGGKLAAPDGFERRRRIAHTVRHRDADGLGAEVEAEQLAAVGEGCQRGVVRHGISLAVGPAGGKESMKLTWFGGTALRVYVGGEIVVVDPDTATATVDRGELRAGADRIVGLAGDAATPVIDPALWRPPVVRQIETAPRVAIASIGPSALLIAAAGEPPLVILGAAEPPRFGRWADGAVVVLTSARPSLVAEATVLLDIARPRLIALAVDEPTLDLAIAELSEHLDGAGLVSLEPGLALEV